MSMMLHNFTYILMPDFLLDFLAIPYTHTTLHSPPTV